MNYEEFKPPADPKDWGPVSDNLINIAKNLWHSGAECILLCANTPHMAAEAIEKSLDIPLIHIAEETAKEIKKHSLKKVGLLGTRLTMEQTFFRERLLKYGIEPIIPEKEDRSYIHATIFNELGRGIFTPEIKTNYLRIINDLTKKGAEGIILGCTEIPLLIQQNDCTFPLFDTMLIHATAAVNFALEN